MSANPHFELVAALKNYRIALERLASAARQAAEAEGGPERWPAAALRVWWDVAGLSADGAARALRAWRAWEGLDVADAVRRLRSTGRLAGLEAATWSAWEAGTALPELRHRRDIEAVLGIPAAAWDRAAGPGAPAL